MEPAPLPLEFFQRDAETVARELLGQYLARQQPEGPPLYLPVTEVEVYAGFADRASHARRGRTPRSQVMFAAGGCFYVYLCYGIHWLLNAIAGPEDFPAAILLRGAGEISGPGRLTKRLRIDKSFNAQLAIPETGLWFARSELEVAEGEVARLPRVGIDFAGPEWAQKPLRFLWRSPE